MNLYLTAQEAMSQVFDTSAKPLDAFNKKNYHGKFESYYGGMLPAFDAIEELYRTVGEPQVMINNMAQAVVSQGREAVEGVKGRNARENMMMTLNMQLAVFVFPAILHYNGESTQPLVDAIMQGWKEAFPKSNVTPARVEYIEKGFHRKFCYITTAVCQSFGKPDDCYELTLLRDYRDHYLNASPEGTEAVNAYYDVAPSIVKHIDASPDAPQIYAGIYEGYIAPCIAMIEAGEMEACKERYMQMVQDMKEQYFTRPA